MKEEKLQRLLKSLYSFDPFSAYPKEADFAIPELGKLAAEAGGEQVLRKVMALYEETKGNKRFPYTASACAETVYEAAASGADLSFWEAYLQGLEDRFFIMALVRSSLNGGLPGYVEKFLLHEETQTRRVARDCIKAALQSGSSIEEHLPVVNEILAGSEGEAVFWAVHLLAKAQAMGQDIGAAHKGLELVAQGKGALAKKARELLG